MKMKFKCCAIVNYGIEIAFIELRDFNLEFEIEITGNEIKDYLNLN